jgi:hypothetical protein
MLPSNKEGGPKRGRPSSFAYVSELNSNLFGLIDAYEGPILGAFQRIIASSLKVGFRSRAVHR